MFIPPIMVHLGGGLFVSQPRPLCLKMLINVVGEMKVLNLWFLICSHVKGEPLWQRMKVN